MQRLILTLCAAALIACGGGRAQGRGPQPGAAVVEGYAATRWIPGTATYAFTARTVREAQLGARDLIESIGLVAGVSVADLSRELQKLVRVDLLSPEALAAIGIDVDGGVAVFSAQINPTLVVRLASPQAFADFMARQGLRVESVVDRGVEVFNARLDDVRLSWAIADGWLWLHAAMPKVPDDTSVWFASTREPGAPTWRGDLAAATGSLIGFVDVARFAGDVQARSAVIAQCASQLQLGLGRVVLGVDAQPNQMSARVALDIGAPLASALAAMTLPVPEGWSAVTAQVPIAAQWNLDLAAFFARAEPCLRSLGADVRDVHELGVRAGRGFLRTFDPDEREGTGAVALDLSHKDFFARQLDDIPMRSALERKQTFGPYAGKRLTVPMFLTVDYVLMDQLALAAVGDGLLVQLVGRGGSTQGPLAALAVQPLGLSVESWSELLDLLDVPRGRRLAERLHQWRDLRVNLTIEGTRLVLAASGTRR